MSEFINNDDELLSAYLDNELAPEERAHVDQRLATDPAARQLLDELRAVSRAVKALPAAPLGADIRDTVLRRAERAMLRSDSGQGTAAASRNSLDDSSPRFTIGRSIRGWVWAGLATAAALAIMAFESNSNRDDKLPESVAGRRIESAERIASSPEPETIAKSKQTTPSVSAIPSPPAAAVPPNADVPAVGLALNEPSPRENKDNAVNGRGGMAAGNIGAKLEGGATSTDRSSAASAGSTNTNMLVVRVEVKPESFEKRSFDDVLQRNGIGIEEPAAESTAALAMNRSEPAAEFREAPTNGPMSLSTKMARAAKPKSANESSAAAGENTDVVLVEAPAAQIQSCLEELYKNDRDYLGVAVNDESGTSQQEDLKDASEPLWRHYSRGDVPQQQTLQRANNDFYFSTPQGVVTIEPGSQLSAGSQQREQKRLLDQNLANASNQSARAVRMPSQATPEVNQRLRGANSRALRLDTHGVAQLNANATAQSANSSSLESLAEKPGAQADGTVQVLFILSAADQPAAAPATETKAAK
jgi:anti-sigma factor RsiW